jgi:dTMP kinase
VVLTDRYVDSSLAYQGVGRKLSIDEIRRISRWATQGLIPDLTILLDMPVEAGLARARGEGDGDKLEAESLEFHRQVRRAFLQLAEAEPRRYCVIDASRPVDVVAGDVLTAVSTMLAPAVPATPAPSETVIM